MAAEGPDEAEPGNESRTRRCVSAWGEFHSPPSLRGAWTGRHRGSAAHTGCEAGPSPGRPDTERIQKSQVSENISTRQIRDTRPLTSRPAQCIPCANAHKTSRRKPDGDLASLVSGITPTPTRLCLPPSPASCRARRLEPQGSEGAKAWAGGAQLRLGPGGAWRPRAPAPLWPRSCQTWRAADPCWRFAFCSPGGSPRKGRRVGKTLQSIGRGGKKRPQLRIPSSGV